MRGIPGFTTPGLGGDHSAFANTTLETWDQLKIERGCMGCHTTVQNNDFVWSLQMNAFDPRPDARQDLPELNALKALLQERLK